MSNYSRQYLEEASKICLLIEPSKVDAMVEHLVKVRERGGRLFFIGVGGSAANCSHAVNDFRKIAGIESYTPTDNVSELTARVNDEGWGTVFSRWLAVSRLNAADAIFVLSVGGGDEAKNVSPNIVDALRLAKERKATILGIVGRDGGYTAKVADACIIIPTLNTESITPHAEAFQAVVWHLMVSHPDLRKNEMKWETVGAQAPERIKPLRSEIADTLST